MTKTFCDVCGSEAGEFFVDATKAGVSFEVVAYIHRQDYVRIYSRGRAHVCDLCAVDLLKNAALKVSERITARQNQV